MFVVQVSTETRGCFVSVSNERSVESFGCLMRIMTQRKSVFVMVHGIDWDALGNVLSVHVVVFIQVEVKYRVVGLLFKRQLWYALVAFILNYSSHSIGFSFQFCIILLNFIQHLFHVSFFITHFLVLLIFFY